MTTRKAVIVMQTPERLTVGQIEQFFREVEPFLKSDRPRLVFDFSETVQLDSAGVQMLLRCIKEVMKRNGDLKLSGIPTGPAVVLELTRVDRFFEIFESTADAVESFHRFPVHAFQQTRQPWNSSAAPQVGSSGELRMAS